MKSTLIVLGALVLMTISLVVGYERTFGSVSSPYSSNSSYIAVIDQTQLWNDIQQWRTDIGKPQYTVDQNLCTLAQQRVVEIQTDYSHNGFYKRLNSGQLGQGYYGENILENADSTQDALKMWINSPEHLKNLISNAQYSCLACQNVLNNNYCVQDFRWTSTPS